MRFFGFDITRVAKAPPATKASSLDREVGWQTVYSGGSWLGSVGSYFADAWQRNIAADPHESLLAFSAVYSCVTLIADDISKLPPRLMFETANNVWRPFRAATPLLPAKRKPNRYQTWQQFLSCWVLSKLLHGNTIVLKERDARGVVVALYILNWLMVTPLVAPDGAVYYQFGEDNLSGIQAHTVTVPASEIIHDRASCLFHPLVGIGPIYACGKSATQGARIQNNSAQFFENASRPGGVLTAPGTISDANALRMKEHWERNYSGANAGRVAVLGDGLKFEAMSVPAEQAQLIEQLRWTGEDVARCFHVPAYKLGLGPAPTFNNAGAMDLDYYKQTLQVLIESIEGLLDDGLDLPANRRVELDVGAFLRLDPLSRAEAARLGVQAGYLAPNEARAAEDLEPLDGGETAYMQQQNYSLAALAAQSAPPPAAGAKLLSSLERATMALNRRSLRATQSKGART